MKIELLNVLNKEEHKLVKGYQVAKNNVIFHEGDVCETIGIIISGKVDIISYSFEGKELLAPEYTSITPLEGVKNSFITEIIKFI